MINIAIAQMAMRIRTEKELLAIKDNPEIGEIIMFVKNVGTLRNAYRWKDEDRITYYPLTNVEETASVLKKHNIDIVHTHNFPDDIAKYFMGIRRKFNMDFKIVHEIHDTAYFLVQRGIEYRVVGREEKVLHDEEYVMKGCDGFVMCSEVQLMGLYMRYDLDFNRLITIRPAPAKYHLPKLVKKTGNKKLKLVYCGNLGVKILDYRPLFKSLMDQGHEVHVYSTRPLMKKHYKESVTSFETIWNYNKMLSTISTADAGIIPEFHGKEIQKYTITPNKLYDYIGAGIPIVYHQNQPLLCEALINKYNVGTSLDKITSKKLSELRKTVHRVRNKLTMESQIDKLLDLYKKVME